MILYFTLITTESSKCPESRKPHSTSCTVFYNCVNLPDGGYVWVPSKCTEGLVRSFIHCINIMNRDSILNFEIFIDI